MTDKSLFAEALTILPQCKGESSSSNGQVLLTEPFLGVCKQVLPVVEAFGTALTLVKSDVGGNIQRLQGAYEKDPVKHKELYEIVRQEIIAGTANGTYSCTQALLWLTRAMDFLLALLRKLEEDKSCSVKEAANAAYSAALKPYHGWLASGAFTLAMQLCPSRDYFFKTLGPGYVPADLLSVVAQFGPMLKENHQFLESVGFDSLTVA